MSGEVAQPTDWSQYTLAQVRAMLAGETMEAGHARAEVWYRVESLCRNHADRLAEAAERLALAWPATEGSAAATFQGVIANLVSSMRTTSQAAYRNGLSTEATQMSLQDTRRRIEELAREYDTRLAAEGQHAGGIQAVSAARAGGGWRADIASRVAAEMAKSDQSVQLSKKLLEIPDPYQITNGGVDGQRLIEEPPPPTTPAAGASSSTDAWRPLDAPRVHASDAAIAAGGAGSQPVLAGVGDAASLPPAGWEAGNADAADRAIATGASVPTGWSSARLGAGAPIRGVIGGGPARPTAPESASGRVRGAAAGGVVGGGNDVRGAAASGLLGGMPMAASGRPASAQGTRVGRPGGVIGGDRSKRRRPHDPDDPWATDVEATAPVIGEGRPGEAPAFDGDELPAGVVRIEGWPR